MEKLQGSLTQLKMKYKEIIRNGEGENYNYSQDHCFVKLSSKHTNGELSFVEDKIKPGFFLPRHHHKIMTEARAAADDLSQKREDALREEAGHLNKAITLSSDTYFYKLGNDSWALHKKDPSIGPDALQDEIAKFERSIRCDRNCDFRCAVRRSAVSMGRALKRINSIQSGLVIETFSVASNR